MSVALEGGCYVTSLAEGSSIERGNTTVRFHIDRLTGATAISLRSVVVEKGRSPAMRSTGADDVLYVLDGTGTMFLNGSVISLEPETGIYVRPGAIWSVENPVDSPLVLVGAICPAATRLVEFAGHELVPGSGPVAAESPTMRLKDRREIPTADRWYRLLVDSDVGCHRVTQFVGSIPPGRAPDHFHKYEEVLVILEGSGRMWAGSTSTEIGPGSLVYLPREQLHCVENTTAGPLRLLGVFYPAGSPAVRYD